MHLILFSGIFKCLRLADYVYIGHSKDPANDDL